MMTEKVQPKSRTKVMLALLAASLAGRVPSLGSQSDPEGLIDDLTHQTAERYSQAYYGCGEITRDRLIARSLAGMGSAALGPLEVALDSIERNGEKSRYAQGAGWLLLVYARIGGPAAESRLAIIANNPKLSLLSLDIDNAIALAQSITSHVSRTQMLANISDCTRSLEPRHALDQLIVAWERGDRQWFEASLGPRAVVELRRLLAGRSWATLKATFWKGRPAPRAMAVGYRFEAAGRWGEPWETLDADPEYRPVSLDARAPRIDTAFKTADGRDCGKYEVEFAEAAAVSPAPPLHYLVDNSNISGLLSTITACAAAGSVHR